MPVLPVLGGREVVPVFERFGWQAARQPHDPGQTRAHHDPVGAGPQGSREGYAQPHPGRRTDGRGVYCGGWEHLTVQPCPTVPA